MSDHFELQTQYPKPIDHFGGRLSITKEGVATFAHRGREVSMSRVLIESASADGIMLSGMQQVPGGRYILQQWWLRYITPSADGAKHGA